MGCYGNAIRCLLERPWNAGHCKNATYSTQCMTSYTYLARMAFHGCCSHSFANLWLVHMRTLPLNLPMLSAKTAARERKLGHLDPLPYLVLVEKEIQSISQGFTLVQHTMCQRNGWLNMWTAESSLIAAVMKIQVSIVFPGHWNCR